ncbi:hypothetical protein D3C83_151290 [compost metagenome]
MVSEPDAVEQQRPFWVKQMAAQRLHAECVHIDRRLGIGQHGLLLVEVKPFVN